MEKVSPPRAKTKHRRKGWVASTVRAMLRNPAYVGEFTFNRRQWLKVPGTNIRRYRERPQSEVIHRSRPHLRIIDKDLWDDTQARIQRVASIYVKKPGPKALMANGKRTSYPLSGLLYCAECGAPLTIFGGSSRRYYGCSDFKKRGTCANGLSLREDVARDKLLGLIHDDLTGPKEVDFIRKTVAEVLGSQSRRSNAEIEEGRGRLAHIEERIARLIECIPEGGSDYIRTALRDLEAQAKTEKRAIAELEAQGSAAVKVPSRAATIERAMLFEKNLAEDPVAGREELRRMFEGGKVLCKPQPEGFYLAEGTFLPAALFSLRLWEETPKARDFSRSAGLQGIPQPRTACSIVGCAGRI
jgi:site-specific DNA recombinase